MLLPSKFFQAMSFMVNIILVGILTTKIIDNDYITQSIMYFGRFEKIFPFS